MHGQLVTRSSRHSVNSSQRCFTRRSTRHMILGDFRVWRVDSVTSCLLYLLGSLSCAKDYNDTAWPQIHIAVIARLMPFSFHCQSSHVSADLVSMQCTVTLWHLHSKMWNEIAYWHAWCALEFFEVRKIVSQDWEKNLSVKAHDTQCIHISCHTHLNLALATMQRRL